MVSTPDVAKDLFSGLWEQNTDLYQAYQNLGDQTSYATSASATNAGYNVVTTSYIPMSCASTTTTSSYVPAARAPTTAYIPTTSISYTPATKSSYIPATTYRPPSDAASTAAASRYSPKTAATSRFSPNSRLSPASCGSSTCSDVSKPDTFEVNTSDYTKLALVLISQSQKKVGPLYNILLSLYIINVLFSLNTLSMYCYRYTLSIYCFRYTLSMYCYRYTLSMYCYRYTLSIYCFCYKLSLYTIGVLFSLYTIGVLFSLYTINVECTLSMFCLRYHALCTTEVLWHSLLDVYSFQQIVTRQARAIIKPK